MSARQKMIDLMALRLIDPASPGPAMSWDDAVLLATYLVDGPGPDA